MIRKIGEKLKKKVGEWLGTTRKKRTEEISAEERSEVNEKLARKANEKEAEAKKWERKYNKLKDSIEKREKENIGKKLQEEKEKLSNELFDGAISLKKLTNILDRKEVEGVSKIGGTSFGRFTDILLLTNGQLAPVVIPEENDVSAINEKGEVPVMTAKTCKDIFRNYKNLAKSVSNGIVYFNLDEDGNYTPNIEAEKVPNIIQDANGNFIQTEKHMEEVQKLLAEKERTINKLHKQIKSIEEAWLNENEKRRNLEDYASLAEKRGETASAAVKDELDKTMNMIQESRKQDRAVASTLSSLEMSERMERKLMEKRDELETKVAEMFPKGKREDAKKEIKNLTSWVMNNIAEPQAKKILTETRKEKEEGGGEEGESL